MLMGLMFHIVISDLLKLLNTYVCSGYPTHFHFIRVLHCEHNVESIVLVTHLGDHLQTEVFCLTEMTHKECGKRGGGLKSLLKHWSLPYILHHTSKVSFRFISDLLKLWFFKIHSWYIFTWWSGQNCVGLHISMVNLYCFVLGGWSCEVGRGDPV